MSKLQRKNIARGRTHARKRLNVLIACEESQAECTAWRELGHNAYSCDIVPCRPGGHPEWHIQQDVTPLLKGRKHFYTMDAEYHEVPRWDLIICHPPCTYLCRLSSVQLVKHGEIDQERFDRMIKAREFFLKCLDARAKFVAVENPVPMKRAGLPRPSCYAEPFWFGVKYSKKTLYWLRNLPPVMPEIINPSHRCYVQASRGKYRSRTFPAMARGIARQWNDYIQSQI